MRITRSVRICAIILTLCVLWAVLGAPIRSQEWMQLPTVVHQQLLQWPVRMEPVLKQWLLRGHTAAASEASLLLTVWQHEKQCALQLSLEEYVAGVTAAEMPARYHPEALKCQAVAARTRAVYACREYGGSGCTSHPACDLCTDPACCQGYLDKSARAERWLDQAEIYEARIAQAVYATAGWYLTWQGMPVEMLYHACSGGMTEAAEEVFSHAAPYLVSVESPGENTYTGFAADTVMTCAEAAEKLNAAFPACKLSAEDIPGSLRLQSTTPSGRIDEILVGSVRMSGHQFRQALGLRSAMCTWDAEQGNITFHTLGYGHGVGMSQAGAQAMAVDGCLYTKILEHYYPGTVLSRLP